MPNQATILLVDDEQIAREILSLGLQEHGYRILEAANGLEAIKLLESETVNAVISDILMPHMDGYRLCYEIRKSERLRDIPFIVYTGTYTAPADEKLGKEFGANRYIRKSGSIDEVLQALRDVLATREQVMQQRESLDELDVMKEYSERLVSKLEEKNVELERAKEELLRKNDELIKTAEALMVSEEALSKSESWLRTILESEPECVKILARDCVLIDMNPAGLKMIEADSLDHLKGNSVLSIVAPEHREAFQELVNRVFEGQTGRLEFEIIALKGSRRWLETHATPLRDQNGAVTQLLSVTRDITHRKQVEHALKKTEEKYRGIFENAAEGIHQSTTEGKYLTVNPAMARMFGYASPAEMIEAVQDIAKQVYVSSSQRAEFIRILHEKGGVQNFEYEAYCKDGEKIWVSANARAVRSESGGVLYYEGTIEDITERKRSEQKLKELARQIIDAQELERKRIARELHDSIGQMLSTVKFRIQSAGEKISSRKSKIWKDLSDAWTLLEQSIHEVRRISHNLRPSVLDDLGLVSAVRSMCDEFSERTSIKVNLKSSRFRQRLAPEVELGVFRIIQEALNNVEQHAQATELALQIQRKNSHLFVKISDNGKGFDPSSVQKRKSRAKGFGLEGILERVSTLGGQIDLKTAVNKGVHIEVAIPLVEPRSKS